MSIFGERVLAALKHSPYWTDRTKASGKTIQGLVCPVCGDKSAWAYAIDGENGPFAINCNRKNSCGVATKTIELLGISFSIEKEYPPLRRDKNRPAREYLKSRGIKKALDGLVFEYWPNVRKLQTGAVMFPVGSPAGEKVFNGRLFNPGPAEGKTHNSRSTTGCYWQHPGFEHQPEKPTFITEGIIDALSLIELGQQSIAVLASGQDPDKVDLSGFGTLVMAFDPDAAGAAATKKWLAAYPDASAIMSDRGQDWNDLLRSGPVEEVKQKFHDSYRRYEVNASLAIAGSAREYATAYVDFFGKTPGIFIHEKSTFYAYHKKRGDDRELVVERVCKCSIELVSMLRDNSNPNQPEFTMQLQISPAEQGKIPISTTASGRDFATPRGWKEWLLSRAGITFEGGTQAATAITTRLTSSKVPEVRQATVTGYDKESRFYIFKHYAVDPTGAVKYPDNKAELYMVNGRQYLKAALQAGDTAIKPADSGPSAKQIHALITGAWGPRGAAAFAFMIGSWFVHNVKAELGFYPFLSITGDPGTGKSCLTTCLQRCQGLDDEGIPVSSTKNGITRSLAQAASLFLAVVEDNNRDDSSMDYSLLLPIYNNGNLKVQATFTNDFRTKAMPFLGALAFVNNQEQMRSRAEKERVITVSFADRDITDATKKSFNQLARIPKNQLARVMQSILQERRYFEDSWLGEYEKVLPVFDRIFHSRIAGNHSILLAFHNLFCSRFKVENALAPYLLEQAEQKVISSAQRTYDQADHFFESIGQLQDEQLESCVHLDQAKGLMYVNLPGVEAKLRDIGMQLYVGDGLTKALHAHPAFVRNGMKFRFPAEVSKSGLLAKQKRVWLFHAAKI